MNTTNITNAFEESLELILENNEKFENYDLIGLTPMFGGDDAPIDDRSISYVCESCNDGKLRCINISLAKRGYGCKGCEAREEAAQALKAIEETLEETIEDARCNNRSFKEIFFGMNRNK